MKRFSMFTAASCLGIALTVIPGSAAQQEGGQGNVNQPVPAAPAPGTQATAPAPGTQGAAPPPTAGAQGAGAAPAGRLPRTASPMPLVGLAGMLSLAAAGVTRKLRKSVA